MEILKNHPGEVKFVVPPTLTTATYKVTKNGEVLGLVKNASVANGVATAALPYAAVLSDGWVEVELTFTHESIKYTPVRKVEVVTPVLDLYEVKELIDGDDAEAADLERAVRHVIGAHTGQTFGFEQNATHKVRGSGSYLLHLPKRLLSQGTVVLNPNAHVTVSDDGWTLKLMPWGPPPVKADIDGFHMHTGGVIHNPNNVKMHGFADGFEYEVTGNWGYENVPEAVREAAKLLVEDYSCADSAYRDRYLVSMTAADWRLQYHSGAYRQTGNVRADQLLNDYVLKRGWMVV